jgi:hypothetical protein
VHRTRSTANPTDRDFQSQLSMTFDGSDLATLTLDSTNVYTLTLSTGAVVKM